MGMLVEHTPGAAGCSPPPPPLLCHPGAHGMRKDPLLTDTRVSLSSSVLQPWPSPCQTEGQLCPRGVRSIKRRLRGGKPTHSSWQ